MAILMQKPMKISFQFLRKIVVVGVVVLCFVFVAPVSPAQAKPDEVYQKKYVKCLKEALDPNARSSVLYSRIPLLFAGLQMSCAQRSGATSPMKTLAKLGVTFNSIFWGDPIGKFTKALYEGNTQAMQLVMTFWMNFDMSRRVDVNANTQGVKNIVFGLSGMALIASFLVGGIRMVTSRRKGLQEGLEDMGQDLGKWFIFSTCFPGAIASALAVSDELSKSILDNFGATSPDTFIQMTDFTDSAAGPVIMAILAIIAIAGSIMQLLALIIRALILPIAVGLTPLFAALSFSETGRSGLHHLVSYTIAALAFKPICALLYAVVLWNVTRPAQDADPNSWLPLIDDVVNVVMIALTGLIAPTLVRMLVPVVSQAGGTGGGQLLAGVASAVGTAIGVAGAVVGAGVGGATGSLASGTGAGSSGASQMNAAGGGNIASAGASTNSSGGGGSAGGSSGTVASGASGGGGSNAGGGGSAGGSSGTVASGASGGGGRSAGGSSGTVVSGGKGSQRHFDRSWTGRIEGAERGATRGRRWISPVSETARRSGGAISTFENMLEASAGHPGQVRR